MKTILITGSNSGIGKATSIHLARNGYKVFATMRNLEKADSLLKIAEDEDLKIEVVELDVNDQKSCEDAVSKVLESENKIDVLINNAAISGSGSVEETPIDTYKQIFETNFFGVIRLIQLVLPQMREKKSGRIINLSSAGGQIAIAPQSPYNSSKFALECLTETLAQEVRRFNIKVSLIQPGVVLTPIHKNLINLGNNDSPYYEFTKRIMLIFRKEFENYLMPVDVAELIYEVVENENPKLRYMIGEDAFKWSKIRDSVRDEQWLTYGDSLTEEEFSALYLEWMGK
ncbi:MAG: SDR family oxidoreductase [Thermodesulfobacteriota bacterium]